VFKKLWHDPVWSKIISALILSAVGVIWAWAHFDLWSIAAKITRAGFAFLIAKSPVPHWMLGLAGLIILAVLILVVAAFAATHNTSESAFDRIVAPPAWTAYTEDTFYNIRWRWAYKQGGGITTPVCFCPRCDCQLLVHNLGRFTGIDIIAFHCPSCDRDLKKLDEPLEYIEQAVILFVEKNIRNNSWKDRVQDKQSTSN